jgi:hypothetical protein
MVYDTDNAVGGRKLPGSAAGIVFSIFMETFALFPKMSDDTGRRGGFSWDAASQIGCGTSHAVVGAPAGE